MNRLGNPPVFFRRRLGPEPTKLLCKEVYNHSAILAH
jgi:hypothetical protein